MTTETKLKQRSTNLLLAYLILWNKSAVRMAATASAVLVEKVTDIIVAGMVIALTAATALIVYGIGNPTFTAVAVMTVAVAWFAALDQLNTSQVATLGQMLFFSAFTPVVLVAYGLGAQPDQVIRLVMVNLQAVFWTAMALFASALLARALVKGVIRIGWAGIKRLRHDRSPDVDPLMDGVQTGNEEL